MSNLLGYRLGLTDFWCLFFDRWDSKSAFLNKLNILQVPSASVWHELKSTNVSKCRHVYCMKVLSLFLCFIPVLCNEPSRFIYLLLINVEQLQLNSSNFFVFSLLSLRKNCSLGSRNLKYILFFSQQNSCTVLCGAEGQFSSFSEVFA